MSQPLPPHLQQNPHPSFSPHIHSPAPTKPSTARSPYGSGDSDDGYTLVFSNITAFQEWRNHEEESQTVEFVKGDTHGSKAVPPRFKDHTKLVCARHSRSGRKKYIKKHPERVRKVPSRKVSVRVDARRPVVYVFLKLEGQGCQASISFKTYFDTEEVRVCYIAEHSHPVGLANLPFTRRGRRAAVEAEKAKSKRNVQSSTTPASTEGSTSSNAPASTGPVPPSTPHVTFSSSAPLAHLPHPFSHYSGQPGVNAPFPQMVPAPLSQNEQWERMSVLFNSIREHARAYEYPTPSVVALESVLVRLYLESPMGMIGGPGLSASGGGMHGVIPPSHPQQGQISQSHAQDSHSQTTVGAGAGDRANSEIDSSIEGG